MLIVGPNATQSSSDDTHGLHEFRK
jgi:hypothetical protein